MRPRVPIGWLVVCLVVVTFVASGGAVADGGGVADDPDAAEGVVDDPDAAEGVADDPISDTDPEPTDPTAGNATGDLDDGVVVELYPNPIAEGNAGEYLIVDLPGPGNWSLADGYHETPLPPTAAETGGRVALASDPPNASAHVDGRVYRLPERFPLAADGDRIELRRDGDPVDAVAYDRATEAEVWNRAWEGPRGDGWRPYGYAPRDPVTVDDVDGEAFLLPDSPDAPVDPLEDADDRLYIAAYTFDSERVTDRLIAAHERGADARLLLEGTPVGGFPAESEPHLDRLVDAGVEVRVLDGPDSRFAFHHAKYAVADDRAVVLTENWKPAGTGGAGSRGWGVTLDDADAASELATLFSHDVGGRDATPWREFSARTETFEAGRASDSYPSRFDPVAVEGADAEVLTAPGNAEDRLIERIDAADDRVVAVVPRTDGADGRLVSAVARAADRGVDSRLLLSGAWYDRADNERLVDTLESETAAGLPLSTTVSDGRGRYARLHAKGVVVDDTVVVGSLNWNAQAAERNREVLVAVESERAADFFARAATADIRGGDYRVPVGLGVGFLGTLVGAGLLARRKISFSPSARRSEWADP